jgi:hypothetical protein
MNMGSVKRAHLIGHLKCSYPNRILKVVVWAYTSHGSVLWEQAVL